MGCHFLPHGIFPTQGSNALQADSSPAEPQRKPKYTGVGSLSLPQKIFQSQESNPILQDDSLPLSYEFSHSVVADSPESHGLQHARLPCPPPTSQNLLKLMTISRCCHPTISSSVIPFSSCLQSFLASGSFPMSQLFPSGEFQLQHQSFQ